MLINVTSLSNLNKSLPFCLMFSFCKMEGMAIEDFLRDGLQITIKLYDSVALCTCGQEDRSGEFRMVLDVMTFVLLRYKDSGDFSKAQA